MSLSRFGPGTILILSALAILAVLLFSIRIDYLGYFVVLAAVLILGIKSVEILQLGKPEPRIFIGQKCLVVKKVTRNERGIIKVYRDGHLDPELWSAESVNGCEIDEGSVARIAVMRSIIVLIEKE
ncbi:MAG: hypothetical protein ACYC7D_05640 [Nitrososphaerales archaeon]